MRTGWRAVVAVLGVGLLAGCTGDGAGTATEAGTPGATTTAVDDGGASAPGAP